MKSAGKGGVVHCLQMLHVHVLPVAPLCTGNVSQSGADQHQRRVPVREAAHYARPAADLAIEPLYGIVGADSRPMLRGKIKIRQRFLNAVFDLPGSLLELHGFELRYHGFGFLPCSFLTLLGVDRLEHFGNEFHLGLGDYAENIAVEVDCATLVFGVRKDFSYRFEHTKALVTDDS